MDKPFSQACENNKQPILQVLQSLLPRATNARVLEVGSGTGQHAVFFAQALSHVTWQTSDLPYNHPGILSWLRDYPGNNLLPPLVLDVSQPQWPAAPFDAIFTANTLHIMAWERVPDLLRGAASVLVEGGLLIIYGPFNYNGQYTSPSNARFDQWLLQQSPDSAIRDFEAVRDTASGLGLAVQQDIAMPANNRILVFRRQSD
jgi:cyclopropane fatty-acyl-phospholipid synthase-like methyltransferase